MPGAYVSYLYATSESVTQGHPDKVCDQVSDAVLDAFLSLDSEARVACETAVKDNRLVILGEVSTSRGDWRKDIDLESIARSVVRNIGYTSLDCGMDADTFEFHNWLSAQSMNIHAAVDREESACEDEDKREYGAGDQGLMFGYATDETQERMPMTHLLATRLAGRLTEVRRSLPCMSYLRPDGKT